MNKKGLIFDLYKFYVFPAFRLPSEERQMGSTVNPMCEVFPKGT
jgi:hypothetical protein